jgi:DNA N-6-adenine-methyltransferase (Dam)
MTRKTNLSHPRAEKRSPRQRAATERKTVGYDRTKGEEQWLTPRYITEALGRFDFDPCSPIERPWPTARVHWTKVDDGLSREWDQQKLAWVNPPYGSACGAWMAKSADHGNGLLLIFSRTDTQAFHRQVWDHPNATALFFFEGRLRFHRVDGTEGGSAGAASVLVAYGETARDRLIRAVANGALTGRVVLLNEGQAAVYLLGKAPTGTHSKRPARLRVLPRGAEPERGRSVGRGSAAVSAKSMSGGGVR